MSEVHPHPNGKSWTRHCIMGSVWGEKDKGISQTSKFIYVIKKMAVAIEMRIKLKKLNCHIKPLHIALGHSNRLWDRTVNYSTYKELSSQGARNFTEFYLQHSYILCCQKFLVHVFKIHRLQ